MWQAAAAAVAVGLVWSIARRRANRLPSPDCAVDEEDPVTRVLLSPDIMSHVVRILLETSVSAHLSGAAGSSDGVTLIWLADALLVCKCWANAVKQPALEAITRKQTVQRARVEAKRAALLGSGPSEVAGWGIGQPPTAEDIARKHVEWEEEARVRDDALRLAEQRRARARAEGESSPTHEQLQDWRQRELRGLYDLEARCEEAGLKWCRSPSRNFTTCLGQHRYWSSGERTWCEPRGDPISNHLGGFQIGDRVQVLRWNQVGNCEFEVAVPGGQTGTVVALCNPEDRGITFYHLRIHWDGVVACVFTGSSVGSVALRDFCQLRVVSY